MELDWRKDIGGTFGSAGVMQEDMSEVEAILSKSRVGSVGIQEFAESREAEYKAFQFNIYQTGKGWHTRPQGDRGRI